MEKVACDAAVSDPISSEISKKVARQETVQKSPSPM
jgi:hypothetical protein